jgi:manganese transport protein
MAFAIALLSAGQSSTLTGTLAGQVVMEGFLHFRMRPWLRRLVTRSVAIVPAVITIVIMGDQGTYKLLILSQVILSMQLPFAVIPLVQFTSDRKIMGEFASPVIVKVLAWATTLVIVGLNVKLVVGTLTAWIEESAHPWLVGGIAVPAACAVAALLVIVILQPFLGRLRTLAPPTEPAFEGLAALPPVGVRSYRKIAGALGADPKDLPALDHSLTLARTFGAEIVLVHVAEGFGPRFFGGESTDQETVDDTLYLRRLRERAESQGVRTSVRLLHGDPPAELARMVDSEGIDLLVMGAHGHGMFGDILYGSTISPLRHAIRIPILIVREDGRAEGPNLAPVATRQ